MIIVLFVVAVVVMIAATFVEKTKKKSFNLLFFRCALFAQHCTHYSLITSRSKKSRKKGQLGPAS